MSLSDSRPATPEERAQLLAEVGRLRTFNRGAAHEMRSAIGALSRLAVLAEAALDARDALAAARHVTVMARQANAAVSLAGALMSFAKPDAPALCPSAVALTDCAEQALQTLALAGAAKGIPPVPVTIAALPVVWADPVLMDLVFVNLIGNAIKFTRGASDGRVEVFATAAASAAVADVGGPHAPSREGVAMSVVCVRDNGVGFSPVRGAALFDSFPREGGGGLEGSGLGLCLVRTIVERHGGRVWARSEPGRGAQFFVALPALVQ
jgi:signal transduction histidine kinase